MKLKMNKITELKILENENQEMRDKIDSIIGIDYPNYSPLWAEIYDLIENEIKQEKLCNE